MAEIQSAPSAARWFAVENLEEVTVFRFTRPDLGSGEAAKAIGSPLFHLVDELGRRRFVLDFGSVCRMSSAVMGKLITFAKKVQKAGGRLTLCSLGPDLHLQFERTRLTSVFSICLTEQEALRGVQD